VNVCLSYAGDLVYEAAGHCTTAKRGDLLFCPNNGGVLTTDLCSGIAFQFDPKRLLRSMAVMLGYENAALDLRQAQALPTSRSSASGKAGGLLHELVVFIDRLLQENEMLPEAMGLEDQCFRSLALELLHANGQLDALRQRRRHPRREAFLDDLVDYIMANLDRPITLTDLEERSHYSGRQLQYMFRRKFECTPLQFVRKQRLKMAMARLEQCQHNDTITKIAKELGYRSTSTFSADFFRQFGTYPSVVLRCQRQQATVPTVPARLGPDQEGDAARRDSGALPRAGGSADFRSLPS
jgi:AraC-like DNA-binding protein